MKLLKTFANYATGSFFALLAGLITTPILTRLISTVEMGKYSMYITVGSLIASIMYLGLDQSYVRFYNDENEEARNFLLRKCTFIPVAGSTILALTLLIFYRPFSNLIAGEESFALVVLFGFYLIGLVIDRFWLLKIRMEQKAMAYSLLNVARKLSYLILSVICVITVIGNRYWSLIIGVTLAEGVLMIGARLVEKQNWKVTEKRLKTSSQALIKYGFPFIFSTTITLIFHSTDKIMLKILSDYNQIGLYSGAQNIVNLITQVQTVFTTFWMPVAFEHYSKEPEDKEFYIKINKLVSYGMLIIAILLLCFKDIVVLFLGSDYVDAVYVFPFLAFMPIMYTVSETTVMGINFKMKSRYHIWISAVCATVNMTGNYFLITAFGAKGAAISTGLAYIVFFILRTFLANKVYPVKFAVTRFLVACGGVYVLAIYASFSVVTVQFLLAALAVAVLISIMYKDILKDIIGIGMKIFKKGFKK